MTEQPLYVGILFSETGVTSVTEKSMLNATLFAIDQVNAAGGINGREIVPIKYNPNSIPKQYSIFAEKLLAEDNINIIFGCYMSSTRKAVLPVVERKNGLLCYPAQYEGFEYSRNIIYSGAVPNQNLSILARYILSELGNHIYIVGSDYIWPWEVGRVMRDMALCEGGEIAGERYLKLDAPRPSYDKLVQDIKSKNPDVIFCNFAGESICHFYRAFGDAGLDAKKMPIASLTTSEADIAVMGYEYGTGHITSATYFQTVDTLENASILEEYKLRFQDDAVTNMCWEAAYFQTHIVSNALRVTGTDDIDILRPKILEMGFDAPQGRVWVDPDNGHSYLWSRIGRAKKNGQFEIVQQSQRPCKPDPYLVSFTETGWNGSVRA
jgi:branched-chain amino acid transport system substrate-binding protein